MNDRIKSIDGGRSRAENPRLRKIPLQDVMVERESNLIRLVHHTAQEYFETQRNDKFPNGHREITNIYLTYLLFDGWVEIVRKSYRDKRLPFDTNLRLEKYAFFRYAVVYWGDHARQSCSSGNDDLIFRYLNDMRRITTNFFWRTLMMWPENVGEFWPLHCSSLRPHQNYHQRPQKWLGSTNK